MPGTDFHVESLPGELGFAMGQTGNIHQSRSNCWTRSSVACSSQARRAENRGLWIAPKGDARADSDLDLLIIEDSDRPRYERSPRYYHALAGVFPAKDIVVYTPDEVKEWSNVPNAL